MDGLLVAFGGLPLGCCTVQPSRPRSNISIIPTSPNYQELNRSAG